MAIIGPADLPAVIKVNDREMKKYIISKLAHPVVEVELTEDQFEIIWRIVGDWIAGYFPKEQRLAVFYTTPLKSTYPLPADAYWIQDVRWDPVTTRLDDVFGAEAFLFNIGNISGIQNILTDYHLLQAYRKFSQKVLGTEGHWEVINEVDGEAKDQLLRLYPTPKGAFPVLVLYYPVVQHFRSPQARLMAYEYMLAEAKETLGRALRKMGGLPSPDGGTLNLDGEALVSEAAEKKKELLQLAVNLGEPALVYTWSVWWLLAAAIMAGSLKDLVC